MCQAKDVNQELILTLDESGLKGSSQYTFGFGVTNPPNNDEIGLNLWGLQLKNYEGSTVDANMRIDGLDLTKINLRYNVMGWTVV